MRTLHPAQPRSLSGTFAATLLLAAALTSPARLVASDGTFDPTWGNGGISAAFADSVPRSAAVAADQTFYFTGNMTLPDATQFEWWHNLNSGGSLWDGCQMGAPFLDNFDIRKALFDSAGRLLLVGKTTVVGTETVDRAFIARFVAGPDCVLDSTFSGSGWEIYDTPSFCDTEDCRLVDLAESNDPTTRYVALLESVVNGLRSNYYLVGLTAAGNLDPNFGSAGFAPVGAANLGLSAGGGGRLVVDPANKIYVLFSFYDPDVALDLDSGLNRYNSAGGLDTTWGDGGTRTVSDDDADSWDTLPRALAIGNDGSLVLALFNLTEAQGLLWAVQPALANWSGLTLLVGDPRAVALDALGRVLVAFDRPSGDGGGILRYLPSDPFGSDSFWLDIDIDAGGANAETPVDLQTPGGRPMILFEGDQTGGGKAAFLVRLENALIFADGFEWGSTKYWN